MDRKIVEENTKLRQTGDELALAAAHVVAHYDGIHRLSAALSKWYNLRAGIYSTQQSNTSEEKE